VSLRKLWRRKRRPAIVDPAETAEHLERANEVVKRADRLIAKERRVIHENHLGQRARIALREAHR
jgi:hypothetical protein